MVTAALFTKAKIWKRPKCLTMDKWIKEMWYIMEYNSFVKIKEILTFATTHMDPEDILLSETFGKRQTWYIILYE